MRSSLWASPSARCINALGPMALLLLGMTTGVLITPPVAAQPFGEPPPLRDARNANPTRFLQWTYRDAGALVQAADVRSLLYALGGTAVLASGSLFDPMLQEEARETYDRAPGAARALDALNLLGDQRVIVPASGVFALTLATDNVRLQNAAFTSLQALIYAQVVTNALKGAVGRSRPDADYGAYRFAPFSGATSFPSGHTTTVFAIFTPWMLFYPNAATYALFALSVGTASARVALNKHWPMDVVAGAAIGFLTARYLTQRHRQGAHSSSLRIVPLLGATTMGISLCL